MTRPRILFVSPRLPFPPNSGTKIRIGNLLRALADIGDVDLVAYGFEREFGQLLDEATAGASPWPRLRSASLLRHPEWSLAEAPVFPFRIARSIFKRDAVLFSTFPAAPLLRQAEPLADAADLIWVARLYAALPLRRHAHKMIVDLDDLEAVKLAREAEQAPSAFSRYALRREARRLARAERAAALEFRRVVVCSQADTGVFDAAASKAWVIPNGVDDQLMDRPAPRDARAGLVFVGTMNYGPNIDAVRHFCRDIFPLVRAGAPAATLSIVGLNPAESVRALHDGRSVFVHANVPEVAPYVEAAAVSIVPLRVGGGTRLKILESMALGTPVVSTTVGAEGLDVCHGEHLLLADSPADFAQAVLRCLADPSLRAGLADRGRNRVGQHYRWSAIRATTGQRCTALLDELRRDRRAA